MGIYRSCSARGLGANNAYQTLSCRTTNASYLETIRSVSSISSINFTVNAEGDCTYINVVNSSAYAPMVP